MRRRSTLPRRASAAASLLLRSLVLCCLGIAPALALEGYATFTSSYLWRGVLLSDGPTLLLGAERALGRDWAIGAWGAGVDRAWPFAAVDAGVQAGAYLARDWRCGAQCSARATLSRYLYPGSAPGGWTELALSARWHERVGASLARGRNDGSGARSRTIEVFAEQPLGRTWSAALLLGHTRYAGFGYRHAELELRRPLGKWQFAFGTHHGETAPPEAAARRRGRLYVALSRGFGGGAR